MCRTEKECIKTRRGMRVQRQIGRFLNKKTAALQREMLRHIDRERERERERERGERERERVREGRGTGVRLKS